MTQTTQPLDQVPFIDFSRQYEPLMDQIFTRFKKVFDKGAFILGEEVTAFEQDFAAYCGAAHAVGVNSGTDALSLALQACGVGPGDEVILPVHTFIATALCVSYAGARPVFVDILEDTYHMDASLFEAAVTPRTKAVIVVHLYGQPADMDEINAVARKKGIKVIEDACQAHGAHYRSRRVGSLGDVACFSFYPTKGLGAAGDAGMVVTNDDEIAQQVRMLRDYGRRGRYEHVLKGYNSRLDTLQAVVLSAKLPRLDEWNEMRRAAARRYEELLAGRPDVITPITREDRDHVYQTYAVRVPDRDRILAYLREHGIGALIHYPIPLHRQEAYCDLGYPSDAFPTAEKVASEILSLPMFPHITPEQIGTVCQRLIEALDR